MQVFRKFLGLMLTGGAVLYAPHLMAEESSKAGLPQLDVSLFPAQLFWLAISFSLLYGVMSFIALPHIKTMRANRKETIASELDKAKKANEAAKILMEEIENSINTARAKARDSIASMTAQAARESAKKQETQKQELAKKLHLSEAKIATERTNALKVVKESAADLAQFIVEKITGSKIQVKP